MTSLMGSDIESLPVDPLRFVAVDRLLLALLAAGATP